MKRGLLLVLAALLLAGQLCGCAGPGKGAEPLAPQQTAGPEATPEQTFEPGPEPSLEPTPEPTMEPAPDPTPEPDRSLAWSKAFREDYLLSEGSLSPEEIAFYSDGQEIGPEIVNVPLADVLTWWNEQESLPRTRYFEQFMPEKLQDLYPILDYAFAHSYSRFCVPTTTFTATDVAGGWKYLPLTYRINNNGISTATPASFDLGGGKTLQYVTVTIKGMDRQGVMQEYQESLAAAREIVAGIPEGSSEYDKALYLYRWFTENVRYYNGEYYESEWNLLYDTLVKKDTVCAGYAEALYVMYNLAGIECFTVFGGIFQNGEWGAHIWNVAKIEGEYYMFDATWDTGLPPERYQFFGVSENTMQSIYPRTYLGQPEEYCPPCTRDLPLPGEEGLDKLRAGILQDGVFCQDFFGLSLRVDDSWTVLTREEIDSEFYGGSGIGKAGVRQTMELGYPYVDLVLTRDGCTVQILIERNQVWSGDRLVTTPADYMDSLSESLPDYYTAMGLKVRENRRFQTEIQGNPTEVVWLLATDGSLRLLQSFYCMERDGAFLSIGISGGLEAGVEGILEELTGAP